MVSNKSEVPDSEILGKIEESNLEIVVLGFPSSRTSLLQVLTNLSPNALLADKLLYFVKELRGLGVKGDSDRQRHVRMQPLRTQGH
jgi:hypothetical protein